MWQVMIQGEIYDADLPTLKQWIFDGYVTSSDKVKKGSLNWIEANRVPILRRVFSGEEQPPFQPEEPKATVPNVVEQITAATSTQSGTESYQQQDGHTRSFGGCYNHPEQPAQYVCRVCQNTFCQTCPKFVGTTNTPLCPLCGDLCQPYQQNVQQHTQLTSYGSRAFGFAEFGQAFKYPFKDVIKLLMTGAICGLLSMAGGIGAALSYMILFGSISLAIRRVSAGDQHSSFFPDLSSFSWWDDVLVPMLLSVGISIVTLGPTVVLIFALTMGWLGFLGSSTPSDMAMQQEQKQMLDDEDFDQLINQSDPEKERKAREKLQPMMRGQKVLDKNEKSKTLSEETEDSEQMSYEPSPLWKYVEPLLKAALPIFIILLIGLGWMIFYSPMALAIAGYTQDFWSVVNPFFGLSAIRQMGTVYFKALSMFIGAHGIGIVLNFGLSMAFGLILAIPLVGFLLNVVLQGILNFYISIVVAYILGVALNRCADKLGIYTS